jgi:hypothetical protein
MHRVFTFEFREIAPYKNMVVVIGVDESGARYVADVYEGTRGDCTKFIDRYLREQGVDHKGTVEQDYTTYMFPQYVRRYLGRNLLMTRHKAGGPFMLRGDNGIKLEVTARSAFVARQQFCKEVKERIDGKKA